MVITIFVTCRNAVRIELSLAMAILFNIISVCIGVGKQLVSVNAHTGCLNKKESLREILYLHNFSRYFFAKFTGFAKVDSGYIYTKFCYSICYNYLNLKNTLF